jgi:hypothetical protein
MRESELILDRIGFPPFSSKHCQQTLIPIMNGELRRTVNGQLIYTGTDQHHKFQSVIQGQDKVCPSFEGVWRGSLIKVGCIQRLSQQTRNTREIFLQRDPVEDSVVVIDKKSQEKEILLVDGRHITLKEIDNNEEYYIFYRPYLLMCVISYKLLTNEWGTSGGWQLDLEEV